MAKIQVAIFNQSTVIPHGEVFKAVQAIQKQVHEDFAPAWGIDADITFYPEQDAPNTYWQLRILDTADQANELGVHELTEGGFPQAQVFVKTHAGYDPLWSVTASHELMEMLVNPDINLTVLREDSGGRDLLYAYEVCDPCQHENWIYEIDGVKVSDFVFPSWFEQFHPSTSQFDYGRRIKEPFELLVGGYTCIYEMIGGEEWIKEEQVTEDYTKRSSVDGGRWQRRSIPRSQWQRSAK